MELLEHLAGIAADSSGGLASGVGSAPAVSVPFRILILLGHSLEDPLPEATELASLAADEFKRSGLNIELRVDIASMATLEREARDGADLFIYYGHGSEDGWLSFTDGRKSFAHLSSSPNLERYWRNLKAAFIFACFGDQFATQLPCPWIAYCGPVLKVTPKTFLHEFVGNLATNDFRAAAELAITQSQENSQ